MSRLDELKKKNQGVSFDEDTGSSRLQKLKELNKNNANTSEGKITSVNSNKGGSNESSYYDEIKSAADFKDKSGYSTTKSDKWWSKLISQYGMGYDDLTYEYINNQDGLRDEIKSKYRTYTRDNKSAEDESDYEQKGYDFLTDDEVAVYNYYYATEGKDKAKEFLDSIEKTLIDRKADKEFEAIAGDTLKELAYGVVSGTDQFRQGVENLGAYVTGDEGFTSATQIVGEDVREDLADNGFKILGSSLGQIGYDLANTTANMLPSIFVGMATGGIGGAVTLGASSTGNAYTEMRDLGYDEWQARGYATLVGASEATLQYALGGISKLGGKVSGKSISKFVSGLDNAFARVAISVPINMASEGLEESIQTVLEPAFKSLVTGEEYEAAQWEEILYSGLLGALSAGFLEGVPTVKRTIASNREARNTFGDGSSLVAEALEYASEESDLRTLAEKYSHQLEGGKKLSGSQINMLDEAIATEDKSRIRNTILKRLGELGETSEVYSVADALVKHVLGEKLSAKERNILNESKSGYVVEAELNRENIKSGGLGNDWASHIGTRRIHTESYNKELYDLAKQMSGIREAVEKGSVDKTIGKLETAAMEKVKVSESGKTIYKKADGSTEDVTIKGIVSTKGGLKVELDNGKTVRASDLSFSTSDEALMYEMVARMDVTPDTANEIISTFKPANAKQASLYFANVPLAYQYGTINYEAGLKNIRLSEAEKRIAFNRGKADAVAKADTKTYAKTKTAPKAVNTTKTGIIYEGDITYDEASANELQKASMAGIEVINKLSSLEVHVFESVVENGERVYYLNGERKAAPNGYFRDGNKIYIDFNAGNKGEGAMLYTMSHEVTHYIREWNAKGFKELGDFLIAEYGKKGIPVNALIEKQKDKIKARYKREGTALPSDAKLFDMAYEEMVSDAMSEMFADPKAYEKLAKLKKQNRSLWKKLGEAIKSLLDKLKTALGIYKTKDASVAEEALYVRGFSSEVYEKLQDLYIKAFVEADANYEAAKSDGLAEKHLKNRDIAYNLRATESHKAKLEEQYSSSASIDLDTLMERYDKIISIWKSLGGELDSKFLNEWNNKVGKDRAFTVFKAQAGYKYNVELSSMCKKGVPLFEAIDTIVKEEVMKQLDTKVLGKAEKEILYDLLKSNHFEIPCAICYVEQARQREGAIIDAFLNGKIEKNASGKTTTFKLGWNEVLKAVEKEMKSLGVDYSFTAVDRSIASDKYVAADISMDEATQDAFYKALKKIANKEITRYNKAENKNRKLVTNVTPSAIKEVFKGTLPSNLKIFKVLFTDPTSRFTMESDLLYSSMTTHNLATMHNELYSLFNSQGGVSGYKTKQGTVVYWGDILGKKWSPSTVRDEGGIRNQSNSDFQMYTLLDQVQMYIDFSAKGYYLQAYTKVLSELKLFGLSRGKINASLIPAVYEYRNADGSIDVETTRANAGLDKNGNLLFDDIEGINHNEAFMLLEDAEYSKSIGGICIGYSDAHIIKLLDDKRVQQIIGFHDKTDDPDKRYRGARYAKNYNGLNEAVKIDKDGKPKTVHIGFNPYVRKAEKKFTFNSKTETYEGTAVFNGKTYEADDIPRLAADMYLAMCEEKGYAPAYEDFAFHENYYKLLADFSLYDSQGHYAPHRKVAYNMPDTVPYLDINGKKKYMPTKDYIKAELEKELKVRDSISEALADKSESGLIPQFVKKVNELHQESETKFSDRDSTYMDAVSRGDMETAQRMVDEAAKKAGYDSELLHHGTNKFGFTEIDVSKSDDGISFFATDKFDTAASYIPYYEDSDAYDKIREIGKKTGKNRKILTSQSSIDEFIDYLRDVYPDQYKDSRLITKEERYKYAEWDITDGVKKAKELLRYSLPQNVEELANLVIDSESDKSKWEALAKKYQQFKDIQDITYRGNYFSEASHVWYGLQDNMRLLNLHLTHDLAMVRNMPESKEMLLYTYEQLTGGENVGIYGLYAKQEGQLVIKGRFSNWNNIPLGDITAKFNEWWVNEKGHEPAENGYYTRGNTRNIAEFAKAAGYRSVCFVDIYDAGAYGGGHGDLSTVYAFFYPEVDVKSADPVTYDDNGNVIPLSERFNAENNDIRYSDRDKTSYAPTFYSHMGKVIDEIKIDKMGATGVVPYLKGKGVKDEEIKWSGIEAFLEGKKSVTKAELQEFVAGSQLQIVEQMSDDEDYTRWSEYKLEGGSNYRELVFQMPNSSYSNDAMRVHWGHDAEGVIAHARIQDMITPDGKKMLFIEEIQSDWHNEGAKDGYADSKDEGRIEKLKADADEAFFDLEDYSTEMTGLAGEWEAIEKTEKGSKLLRKYREAKDAYDNAMDEFVKKTPDAPFRNTYHEYVLKRLLRMAAEEGYDSIGWTPADIQSKRWSEEYAEGYRIEYDQDIPKFLRKYGKKWGATVGKTTLDNQSALPTYVDDNNNEYRSAREWFESVMDSHGYSSGGHEVIQDGITKRILSHSTGKLLDETLTESHGSDTVWSMDIPDSMKDSVLYEGQVMYSDRDDLNKAQSNLRKKYHIDPNDVIALANRYLDNYTGRTTKTKMRLQFLRATEHMAEIYTTSELDLLPEATKIAEAIASDIEQARTTGTDQDLVEIKRWLRSLHIQVPTFYKAEFERFGGIGEFRKRHMGKFILSKDGKQVDTIYPELQGLFGTGWFPDIDTVPDQLIRIAEVSDMSTEIDLADYDFDAAIEYTREEIISELGNLVANSINKQSNVHIDYRDSSAVSHRTLLANALESTIQNEIERNKLAQYKAKIALIESEQAKLDEIRAKAKELRFKKGRTPDETKMLRDLDAEATQIANRISTYDKQLLNLESTTALKNVLEREKAMLRRRLEQKSKESLKAHRERAAKTQRELMNRYQDSRKKAIEGRHKTEIRHKIKNVVSDLNKLLLNPTKDQHVPIGLQLPVAEALDAINMDTMNAEERVAYYNDLIAKSSDPDEIAMLTKKRDFFEYRDANFKERITALKNAYAEFKESDDPLIRNAHNDAIEDLIKNTADAVGNKSLKDMSLPQLEAVYNMYKAILATVRNSNKMFKEGRQETVTDNSEAVKTEVREVGGHKDRVLKITKFIKKFGWEMLKPITAMKAIGSKTFERLFDNVRAGEDTWAVDVSEAKQFYDAASAKYGYDKWDFKKRYTFKDSVGTDFSLSLEQIMSLYAYSKREQADKHLEFGGFIFDEAIEVTEKNKLGIPLKYEVNDANPYRLRKEDLMAVTDALTKEQKGFIDEMQTYLSEVMGAKGNEVSLAMYDIKLYTEKNYFPLKTSRYFREFDPEKSGTPKIKNSGFSKKTVPQAGNPIVLSNFMDVWATHVNDMSMYHAFVLPLEDFLRVYNYSSTAGGYDSVQQYIKNAYGSQANQYIERLMDDLNGGARTDSSAGIINRGLSLFKKASTFASASVVVQQPSAIARALAYINPKYFVASTPSALNLVKHKTLWAEVKKYAPVAIIKEMGYFDTGVGRSTVEWLKGNKTIKDKVDDALSKAPAMADELVWVHIWEAVKRETAAKNQLKPGSEDFLKECGRRFTEVITNTQVYDSVLSRSGMMRSKDTGMKMATAFMAEPTTTVNMMVDGILQGKRGNKKFTAATVGAISASVILNSILVALVYAARDDDEDETYLEKYLGRITSELLDGFNPLTYIPFVKDIWSIAQGYDVERSDMSVVSKLWESIEGMFDENTSGFEKVTDATGAISSLFGIPLKNLIRDAKGMYNLTKTILSDTSTTKGGIRDSIEDSFKSSIPLWDRLAESDSKTDKLYDAIMSGYTGYVDRIKKTYKDNNAYETAIRKALRENDPRIKEAAQADVSGDVAKRVSITKAIIAEGHFSQDTVVAAINAEISAIKRGEATVGSDTEDKNEVTSMYKSSDINVAFDNGDNALALDIIDDLIDTKVANGKTEKEAKSSIRSSMTSYWKPLYKQAYQSGNISEMERIRRILYSSGLYGSANDVVKTAKEWLKG